MLTGIEAQTERVARGLITCTLPKSEWTHHAHLRAGLWHLLHYSDDIALDLLRKRIRAYNESTGVANTATAGYHETITRFYLIVIRHFLNGAAPQRQPDDLAQELIAGYGDKQLPLGYYTRERLFSEKARREWLPPDIAPLPGNA